MFSIRVVEGTKLQILKRSTKDMTPILDRIGKYLVRVSQVAFANQRFGGRPWAPRSVPNIMGVVTDLARGPSVQANRFEPRPALVDTGALRRSILYSIVGPKTVQVASSAPYAKLQNEGGKSSLPVTRVVKKNLASLLRGRKDLRPALGFLFRKRTVSVNVRPRPFLGVPEGSREKIGDLIERYLEHEAERIHGSA